MRKRPPWYRSKILFFRRVVQADLERAVRRCFHKKSSRTDIMVIAIAEAVMDFLEGKE